MNYFAALLYLCIGASLLIAVNTLPSMTYDVNDLQRDMQRVDYAVTYGTNTTTSTPAIDNTSHAWVISIPAPLGGYLDVTIPFIGEAINAIWEILAWVFDMIAALTGFVWSIATLGSMFPSWMQPIFAVIDICVIVCIWKIIAGVGT